MLVWLGVEEQRKLHELSLGFAATGAVSAMIILQTFHQLLLYFTGNTNRGGKAELEFSPFPAISVFVVLVYRTTYKSHISNLCVTRGLFD